MQTTSTLRFHLTTVQIDEDCETNWQWMLARVWRKGKPLFTVGGTSNWCLKTVQMKRLNNMECLTYTWNDTSHPKQCIRMNHENGGEEMLTASCWEGSWRRMCFEDDMADVLNNWLWCSCLEQTCTHLVSWIFSLKKWGGSISLGDDWELIFFFWGKWSNSLYWGHHWWVAYIPVNNARHAHPEKPT